MAIKNAARWCYNKVLPLAYDASLTYYETLLKVTRYLNMVIETVNEHTDVLSEIQEAIAQFSREEIIELKAQIALLEYNKVGRAELHDVVDIKMNKHIIYYQNGGFYENNIQVTYDELYSYLIDKPDFVVLIYENYAYHPNKVGTNKDPIIFIANNTSSGYNEMHRVTIDMHGVITTSYGRSEMVANKTTAITDLNKDSDSKFPTIGAVTSYIDDIGFPTDQHIKDVVDEKLAELDVPTDEHINGLIDTKIDSLDIPTDEHIDGLIDAKIDTLDIPTDEHIDGLIDTKIDTLDIPTDEHIDGLIDTKIDTLNIPTDEHIDGLIDTKIDELDIPTDEHIDGLIDTKIDTLDIPTDEHINSLIDTKLGVIENGYY